MLNPGVILLAAGKSQRFRDHTGRHKLLEILPASALTIFEQSLLNIQRSGLAIRVILRPGDRDLQTICQRRQVKYQCLDSQGMGHSIATGVTATPEWSGWIIALADMPYITSELFIKIAEAVIAGHCVRPIYRGEAGHPVGFPSDKGPALRQLKGEEGAREILNNNPLKLLEVSDAGCLWDIDLPEHNIQPPR